MPLVVPVSTAGLLSPTGSSTLCALTQNVLNQIQDWRYTDTHAAALAEGATSITVASDATTRYEIGDEIEWRDDCTFERAIITAVATTALTVLRGQRGSTRNAHSAGAVFVKNPEYAGHLAALHVNAAVEQDLWGSRLYAVYQASYTPASPHNPYFEAPARAERLLRVYQLSDASPTSIDDAPGGWSSAVRFSDATMSSTSRYFYVPYLRDPDNLVYAQYAVHPQVADLSVGACRIVELGALWRLLGAKSSQGGTRDTLRPSGTASPGTIRADANFWIGQQRRLIEEEAARLRALAPVPRVWTQPQHLSDGLPATRFPGH